MRVSAKVNARRAAMRFGNAYKRWRAAFEGERLSDNSNRDTISVLSQEPPGSVGDLRDPLSLRFCGSIYLFLGRPK